jgi:hypothetical protein
MTLGSRSTRGRSALTYVAAMLLALPLVVTPKPARAEEAGAETRTIARELALQGATAFENGDFSTALDRFQRAASLFQAPSITLMQARTLVRLGRFVEALDVYESTQRMTLPPEAPEALTLAVADARRESEELRARTPWLKIVVQGGTPGQEARVTLDGKAVPSVLLNIERPVDPGSHEVEASFAGLPTARRVVSLGEGEHRVAHLQFEAGAPPAPLEQPRPASTQTAPAAAADHDGPSNRKTWGYIAGGAGIAALGVSAVSGVIALNKQAKLDEVCHPEQAGPISCPGSSEGDMNAYYANRTLSYATLALGLVGVGTGAYLLLSGSPESSHVAVGVSGTGAWLRGKF